MLFCLDEISKIKIKEEQEVSDKWKAFSFGVESNLLILWSMIYDISLYDLIGIQPPIDKKCYYTIGISDDQNEIQTNLDFGSRYTPFLKIKVNQHFDYGFLLIFFYFF